ncbi:hypothetical protein GCM10009555_071960 [Acrocarpospora macrocephala]|uniref:Uncharacterized protein n=1 Tax=Acrocarpospora macrocephala TaxID=150177 RepID=A0A5M3WR34_9ACTN|nr:hypothetical protein [Acrocarpospora macrocephala]GES08658.1 hypothetical protein Amac_022540 [Acrocarpospora macrocephala]
MAMLHFVVQVPVPLDPASLTLLMLGSAIMLVLGAIRWLIRRAHIVAISGGSVLVVFLTILILAYLVTLKTT